MGRKNNLPLIQNIEVVDVAAEGKAIAKIDGMVVFIPYVVPGDVLDVQVTKKRKSYIEALPVTFHKYSPLRQAPVCEHFGVCGGPAVTPSSPMLSSPASLPAASRRPH